VINFLIGSWHRTNSIQFEHLVTGAAGSVHFK
jgi:hypothetical protein